MKPQTEQHAKTNASTCVNSYLQCIAVFPIILIDFYKMQGKIMLVIRLLSKISWNYA